ncbi:hypothetical protein [Arthrobacter sp. D2-10]
MPFGSPEMPAPRRETAVNDAWVLAPLIAGQPEYRAGRWIGDRFQYPRSPSPLRLTKNPPAAPAAVLIHAADGSVRTLCLDLDTSKARKAVVDADAERLGSLLTVAGIRYVEDFSPSGGRHIYIPLQQSLPAAEAREIVEAMAFLAPSLDPGPHQNITDGCIRVPGSAHKFGGHQILITPLTEAYSTLKQRNSTYAVDALRRALAPELRRLRTRRHRAQRLLPTATDTTLEPPPGSAVANFGSQSVLRSVAITGLYDTERYSSDSEARMAVLTHFAACRWTLEEVRTGMTSTYPGLSALYGAKAERLLPFEWAKATTWLSTKQSAPPEGKKTAHNFNTSLTKPTGGATNLTSPAIQQLANDLENVLYAVLDARFSQEGRVGISLKLLFRAVLAYVRTNESNVLDVGCRTFAVALGKDHVTISRLLPLLESVSSGVVTRIQRGRGRNADTYLIQLPERFTSIARQLTWRKGKIHAIRPVFRSLGDVAALTYEAIERGRHSPTTADLVRSTGFSRGAIMKALSDMETLHMVRRHHGRWATQSVTDLTALADRLGVTVERQEQITRYRKERARWHAWLDRHLSPELMDTELYDAEVDEYWIPPQDDPQLQHSLWNVA